jgi:hypothetical protein
MMSNLVSPRARRRAGCPMRDHDALPPDLRRWATAAALPWSARSLRRLWDRALRQTGCRAAALATLDAAEARALGREAPAVWGAGYQACGAFAYRR